MIFESEFSGEFKRRYFYSVHRAKKKDLFTVFTLLNEVFCFYLINEVHGRVSEAASIARFWKH